MKRLWDRDLDSLEEIESIKGQIRRKREAVRMLVSEIALLEVQWVELIRDGKSLNR